MHEHFRAVEDRPALGFGDSRAREAGRVDRQGHAASVLDEIVPTIEGLDPVEGQAVLEGLERHRWGAERQEVVLSREAALEPDSRARRRMVQDHPEDHDAVAVDDLGHLNAQCSSCGEVIRSHVIRAAFNTAQQ